MTAPRRPSSPTGTTTYQIPGHGPCPCCDPKEPEHHLWTLTDTESGDTFRVRVPHSHRFHPLGWGDLEHVRWRDELDGQRYGLPASEGPDGVRVVDPDGEFHLVRHEDAERRGRREPPQGIPLPRRRILALGKAVAGFPLLRLGKARELKPGQRWITVHPNGPEEKGVPVLIQENGDGTHRIIGGAGGKLTHLRLTNVKTPEEHAAAAKERAGERRAKEKERRSQQSDEDREKEKQAKADVEAAKLRAEREFVEKVRSKAGGVSEDLDEERLKGLSDGARNLILTRHHKKQLREAVAVKDRLARKLVDEGLAQAEERTAIRQAVEEDPTVASQARDLAETELHLRRVEEEERKAQRREQKTRQTTGQTQVGTKAARNIIEAIEKAPTPDPKELGDGDAEAGKLQLSLGLKPSEEVERRAAVALYQAKALVEVAKQIEAGGETTVPDKIANSAVADALRAAEVESIEAPGAAEALIREASRRMRRHEIQQARAERFREIERDPEQGGELGAEKALAYSDLLGQIASSASVAKRLGLTEAERVPLQEPEIAAITDVLQDAQVLREKQREFTAMNKAAESGDYDRSRRAFDLNVQAAPEAVELEIQDEVRRALTERLLGLASTKRSAHLGALAAGHHDAMADIGLGIGGQRYIDRPTVDALGVKNASLLLRHAMEADGHAPEAVLRALEDHHVGTLEETTQAAIRKAESYVPGLATTVEDVGDIEKAVAQLDAHHQDIDDAQRAVGSALGRMEAVATTAQAFRQRLPESMEIQARGADLNSSLQWLHAIGLKPEDYSIDYKEGRVNVPRASWDKMLNRLPREDVERRQLANEIKAGKRDETGWLPPGIARREASTFTFPVPGRPRYFEPLDWSRPVEESLRDHIGSRLADGEHPRDVYADLTSPVVTGSAPDRQAYLDTLHRLIPNRDAEGNLVKMDALRDHFEGVAREYLGRKYGEELGGLHGQDLRPDDPRTHEAVYRALADHPETKAAFVPVGDLAPEHGRILRDYFRERMGEKAQPPPEDGRMFEAAMKGLGPEPPKMAKTLGTGVSQEWKLWDSRRRRIVQDYPQNARRNLAQLLGQEPPEGGKDHDEWEAAKAELTYRAASPWEKFVHDHKSLPLAYQALQDELRGRFASKFAEHYGRLHGTPPRLGVQAVANMERHLEALMGRDKAEEVLAERRRRLAGLQSRGPGGRYAAEGQGSILGKEAGFLERQTAEREANFSLFSARQLQDAGAEGPQPGDRVTLGERAENQLASLMPHLGAQFEAGRPVKLFGGLNMDGPRVHQQRVIKMLDANGGRLGLYGGTGFGKSLVTIGAFAHQHAQGKATHGLFLVPAAVQDQFGAEMLRYTEPGRFRWATGSGMSHDDRVAMLKDPKVHMRVLTHQSFRDTALQLMAEHQGKDVDSMKQALQGADTATRARWMREAFDAHGIPRHFTVADEAHMATERGGNDPSGTHLVIGAASHPTNATHFVAATATPHKNDETEVYSMAAMLDPERYGDRHAFMQAFGQDLGHNPNAVRRELSHLTYSARVDPDGVDRIDSDNPRIADGKKVGGGPIELAGDHKALVDRVRELYERARKARARGEVDVDAIRELSPGAFEGKPDTEHRAIAKRLAPSLGIVRESALRRAINQAPPEVNQKLHALTEVIRHDLSNGWTDRQGRDHKGKRAVVFTDSLREARMIHEHLRKQGVRAALYHGGLSAQEREAVRLGFQPEGGQEPIYDVAVMTSAGEAGLNLQGANVVHHWDVPQTEKSHAQRAGRAYRQGQQGDVDVHNWYTDDDFEQAGLRRLKRKSDLAAVFQSPIANLDETGIAGAYHRALAEQQQGRETEAA